jgi:hypothetical protein
MPKNIQNSNSASRHSLRRNQVQSFVSSVLSCVFILLKGLSHLSQKETGMVSMILYTTQSPDLFLLRDVMLHALTVLHVSSTCFKLCCLPFPNLTSPQTMACSDQCTSSTRLHVSCLLDFAFLNITIIPSRSHPTEPQCSYDPVEGLPLAADADPLEKIRELEEQVGALLCSCPSLIILIFLLAALTRKLKSQRGSVSPARSGSPNHLRPPSGHHFNRSPSMASVTLSPEFEPCGIATPNSWTDTALDPNAVPSNKTPLTGSPGLVSSQPGHNPDSLSGLIYSGWNPDLPDPAVLDH